MFLMTPERLAGVQPSPDEEGILRSMDSQVNQRFKIVFKDTVMSVSLLITSALSKQDNAVRPMLHCQEWKRIMGD